MNLTLSTVLDAHPDEVWREVNRPELLLHVAWPLLVFEPLDPDRFPERWEEREYRVRMRQFGVLPVGWQVIGIERPPHSDRARHLRDNGRGTLASTWDHLITVEPIDDQHGRTKTRYTDRLGVRAGLLTPMVWAFARLFYAHRQRRWRRLVRRGFEYGGD